MKVYVLVEHERESPDEVLLGVYAAEDDARAELERRVKAIGSFARLAFSISAHDLIPDSGWRDPAAMRAEFEAAYGPKP